MGLSAARGTVVVLLLGSLFAASSLLWLKLDRSPPAWDDAWYLSNSLTVYDALTHAGIPGYLTKLNSVFGFKAPLIAALPAPFYLMFGRRWHAAYLVNIAAMLLLFAALYRIASRWWSPRAAAFVIVIAGSMPLLYGLSRWYMVEYVMAALLTAAVCVLVESDRFQRDGYTVLFGGICGFGLLLKVSWPLFALLPFLYVWFRSKRRVRALLLVAIPCLVLALPWYAGHLRTTLANALDAGFGAPAAVQGTGPVFSLRAIATYLSNVMASGTSWYFFFLAVPLSLWALSRKRRPSLLLSAWLLPFALFAFGGNKDVRYIAPLLPAAALVLAFLLDFTLPRNRAGTAIACLLLVFPVVQMFAVSFGIPYSAAGAAYSRRFNTQGWPHDEIVRRIAAHAKVPYGTRAQLVVAVDRAGLNADNVELSVVGLELPFAVETTAHERNFIILLQRLSQASFVLIKEGGEPESPAFNPYAAVLARIVAGDKAFREIPYGKRLPDGGVARIYEKLTASEAPEEFAVDFGGIVALTGFSAVPAMDSIAVKFRWRFTGTADRDYWCFTHLIDPANRIVAQLDRPLKNSGAEEIFLRLPPNVPRSGLRLRFGIYNPASGERLRVNLLPPAASSRFTLADQSTALLTPASQ